MKCKYCKNEFIENELKCPKCGYPSTGTFEDKKQFVDKEIYNNENYKSIIKSNREAQSALFGIAVINIIILFLLIGPGKGTKILNMILYMVTICIYVVLGFKAKSKPLISSIIGLVLLLLGYLIIFIGDPSMITRWVIFKMCLIAGLVYAIFYGYRYEKLKKTIEYLLK